jgi:hypothetical protein
MKTDRRRWMDSALIRVAAVAGRRRRGLSNQIGDAAESPASRRDGASGAAPSRSPRGTGLPVDQPPRMAAQNGKFHALAGI